MGSDLYNNLTKYFVNHLQGLREVGIARSPIVAESLLSWI
jgi:hypothetical protein